MGHQMIVACVIVYDEARMLPGCLTSVGQQVDRMVVVDGAFAQFPHEIPYSTDGSDVIADAFGAEWVEAPRRGDGTPVAWASETVKRQAYLEMVDEGDWVLVIDADERLMGVLPDLVEGTDHTLAIRRGGHVSWGMRLFQKRGDMRYEGAHNGLWRDSGLVRAADGVRSDGCFLAHLDGNRRPERVKSEEVYDEWRRGAEKGYRERHSI